MVAMVAGEKRPGILAIWNDCRAGREAEFEAWFQGEHLLERLAVPGFLFARRRKLIMSEVFINMNRTVCRRTIRRGGFRGAYVVTVRFNAQVDEAALVKRLEVALQDPAVASGEIWAALDPAGIPVSMEEKLRGGDKKIKGALMIDTLRQRDAELFGENMAKEFPAADVGVFRVLCQLGREVAA